MTIKMEYKNYKGKRKFFNINPVSLEFGTTPHNSNENWLLKAVDLDDNIEKKFVINNIQRFAPEKQIIPCVTVYIINKNKQFFMMHHTKLNNWVPSGGKIENNETPEQAAVREVFEETGLQIELIPAKNQTPSNVLHPVGVQLNIIKPNEVEHLDWIYFATCQDDNFVADKSEAFDAKWISIDDIATLDTFDEVQKWCEYFYNL